MLSPRSTAAERGDPERGERRHRWNDLGAELVRLGRGAPSGGGKRSREGGNHLFTPVSPLINHNLLWKLISVC